MHAGQSFFVVINGDFFDIWMAAGICESNGGELASIHSKAENQLVQDLVLAKLPVGGWFTKPKKKDKGELKTQQMYRYVRKKANYSEDECLLFLSFFGGLKACP